MRQGKGPYGSMTPVTIHFSGVEEQFPSVEPERKKILKAHIHKAESFTVNFSSDFDQYYSALDEFWMTKSRKLKSKQAQTSCRVVCDSVCSMTSGVYFLLLTLGGIQFPATIFAC